MEFGSKSADVYWALVEDLEKLKNFPNFTKITEIDDRVGVGKGEKAILEKLLNEIQGEIEKAIDDKSKIAAFLKKEMSSARSEKKESGWVHNKVSLVVGLWGV